MDIEIEKLKLIEIALLLRNPNSSYQDLLDIRRKRIKSKSQEDKE